jgi:ABC-type molybdate transport system substrate-binding protein
LVLQNNKIEKERFQAVECSNSEKVLANLGIFEAVKGRIIYSEDGQALVATGEAELGMFNVSEIPRAEGVVRAGAIPAAAQVYITYDAGIPRTSPAPDAALALVTFLSRPSAKASWERAGLGLVGE